MDSRKSYKCGTRAGMLEQTDGQASLISDKDGGKIMLALEAESDIFADFMEQILHGQISDLTAKLSFEATIWALLTRDDAEKKHGERYE